MKFDDGLPPDVACLNLALNKLNAKDLEYYAVEGFRNSSAAQKTCNEVGDHTERSQDTGLSHYNGT